MFRTVLLSTVFLISQSSSIENSNNQHNRPPSLWRTILNNRTINEITTNIDIVKYKNLQQALSYLLTEVGSTKTTDDFLNYPQRLKQQKITQHKTLKLYFFQMTRFG